MSGYPLLCFPVGMSCFASCSYCMRTDLSHVPHMSEETLRLLMTQYGEAVRCGDVLWSGGEPLLAGVEFFKLAVSFQKPGTKNSIQTNGLLIDDAWCEFFRENEFVIGCSYDGLTGGSRGPGQDGALEALRMLRARGVAYSVLCVVSGDNLPIPERIIEDLASRAHHVTFLAQKARTPELRPGTEPTGPQFAEFLQRVWEHVWRQKLDVSIRNFDAAATAWAGHPIVCEQGKSCGYAVVDERGNLYPCDHFTEDHEWLLGNIHVTHMKKLMECGLMGLFRTLKQIEHPVCEACPVKPGCNRGCPRDRWLTNRDFSDISPQCAACEYAATITKPITQELP